MAATNSETEPRRSDSSRPPPAWPAALMEAVVLLMVCGTPWAFGADEPVFEYLLGIGLAALALLWAMRNLLGGELLLAGGLATWCFAGLFVLGVLQLTPLPRPLLEV